MNNFKGIFAAMTTPLDDSGEAINEERYRDYIDHLIEGGLYGLVLCSGTGEYAYLRPEERRWLIEEGARHVDGRGPPLPRPPNSRP